MYPEFESYIHRTFTMDDFIAETDAASTKFAQPSTMRPVQYAKAMVAISLRFREAYILKRFFMKGLLESVCHSYQSYLNTHPESLYMIGLVTPHHSKCPRRRPVADPRRDWTLVKKWNTAVEAEENLQIRQHSWRLEYLNRYANTVYKRVAVDANLI